MLRLNDFEVVAPQTVAGALEALGETDDACIVAGGTDFVPKMKRGQFTPARVVSLSRVDELRFAERSSDSLRLGALSTLRAIERTDHLAGFDSAREAVSQVATPVIRHAATIGGNLLQDTRCRYYDRSSFWRDAVGNCLKKDGDVCRVAPGGNRCFATFCSDMAAALIVLDARVKVSGAEEVVVPVEDLYRDDGACHVDIRGKILTEVLLEAKGYRSTYKKLRIRGAFDFPEVGVAVAIRRDGASSDANVAVVGVGPRPVVYRRTISNNEADALADEVFGGVKPVDTMFFPPAYRKKMAKRLLKQSLDELLAIR